MIFDFLDDWFLNPLSLSLSAPEPFFVVVVWLLETRAQLTTTQFDYDTW